MNGNGFDTLDGIRNKSKTFSLLTEQIIVNARGSMSLTWLQEKEQQLIPILQVFRESLNSVGVYAGPSSDWLICKRIKYAIEVIQKRMSQVQRMNDKRNKKQLARRRHLADVGVLINDGVLPEMRRRLDRLEASKNQIVVTSQDKVAAQKQYEEIFTAAEEEQNELVKQGNEMEELFGIKRNEEVS